MNQIFHADCLDILKTIPSNSVDAVITDPPYGYLKHKLDCPFDAQLLFSECFRVLKDTGAIIFFGRGVPFAKWNVICDDLGFIFKEELIWYKKTAANIMNKLLRIHESASLFSKKDFYLNKVFIDKIEFDKVLSPQNINQDYERILSGIKAINSYEEFIAWSQFTKKDTVKHGASKNNSIPRRSRSFDTFNSYQKGSVCKSILLAKKEHSQFQHPTQKPVKLFKQLVELTTKEGDLILDPFAGSFTTSLACLELNRKYICIEKDKEYFEVGKNRIKNWHEENSQKDLFAGN
jgi:site-specific DNA-methyltransferase (adenine-specific)